MATEEDVAALSLAPSKVLNVNIGIMGHVDSGKTSLARALSTTLSTASLVPIPDHIKEKAAGYEVLQFTLVDCPGSCLPARFAITGIQIACGALRPRIADQDHHRRRPNHRHDDAGPIFSLPASSHFPSSPTIPSSNLPAAPSSSFISTRVIDVTKGIQTQTAECLVIGEVPPLSPTATRPRNQYSNHNFCTCFVGAKILMDQMVLVLNKVDQVAISLHRETKYKTAHAWCKVPGDCLFLYLVRRAVMLCGHEIQRHDYPIQNRHLSRSVHASYAMSAADQAYDAISLHAS
eukprot:3440709-Rhodomonas_salina.3